MGFITLLWLAVIVAVILVITRILNRQLPPAPLSDQDRLLAQQAEQIEHLETELWRLKDQADFTEKLLIKRSSNEPQDALDGGDPPVD